VLDEETWTLEPGVNERRPRLRGAGA
jgi:hypothetical protein